MTAPSRARTTEPVLFGAPPGRKYVDELPVCELLRELYGPEVASGVFEAPSVTTIVKGGSPTSWALRKWDREEVARYAVRQAKVWSQLTLPDGRHDEEAAIQLLQEAPFRSLGRAASRGTDVHKVLELTAKGQPIPVEAVSPDQQGWVRAVARFWLEHAPVPVWVEVSVYSRNLHQPYAGTLDLIVWLRTGPNGEWELWLIDLKTGKGVYGDMALQQAAYRYAHYGLVTEDPSAPNPVWRRERLPRVQRMGILNAHEDGSYDLVELHEVDSEGVPATEHFSTAYERWNQAKAERSLVGPRIPVPGRLEVEMAGSLLIERLKRLPEDWAAWLAGMWPAEVPRPGPVMRGESAWTASHVETIDKLLAGVEAELQLPLQVPPRMDPTEQPPHRYVEASAGGVGVGNCRCGEDEDSAVHITPEQQGPPDAFAGLPDFSAPEPLRVAAEDARNAVGRPRGPERRAAELEAWRLEDEGQWLPATEAMTAEEWDEKLAEYASRHQGRLPTQEAHFQAQLARLAQPSGLTSAPEVARGDNGLTDRQLEQFNAWVAMVVEAEKRLPSDLWNDVQGWAAAQQFGNVRSFKPSVDTHRKLELLAGQLQDRYRKVEDRAKRLTDTLRAYFPPTDHEEELDGEPDPQLGMWGHLVAIAVTKDDTLEDKSGVDFIDHLDSLTRLTGPEATIAMELAHELGALRLHLAPVVDGDTRTGIRLGVNEAAMSEALKALGGARDLTRMAKEVAIRYGLPHRPTKAADVLASPILCSLLLAPSRT